MYICLCNALTDTDILQAAAQGARRPRDVHEACGCVAQCGSCSKQIIAVLRGEGAAAMQDATLETPALVVAAE